MNLPPLTAEASLYKSNGHYRTNPGTSLVGPSTRRIARIYPTQSEITSTMVGGGNGFIDVPGNEIINVHSCPPGYEDQGGQCVPIGGPGTIGTEIITVHGTVPEAVTRPTPPPAPPGFRDCSGDSKIKDLDPRQVKDCRNGYKGDFFCDLKTGEIRCCRGDGTGTGWYCIRLSDLSKAPPGFQKCGDQDLENKNVAPYQQKACRVEYGGEFYCNLAGEMLCCRRDPYNGDWECKNLKELWRIPMPKARVSPASGKGWKTREVGRRRTAK